MTAVDSSIRRNAMRGMGGFVYVLGVVQILSILPSFFLVRGEGLERLVSLSYVLLSVLMGLIFVFIGYVFRKNLRNYLGGTILASVAYVVIGVFYGMYVSAGPVDRVPGTYYLDPVLILSTVTLLPVWTGVMGVYEYTTPDHRTPTRATGQFRWLGILAVAFVFFIAMLLAGAPSTFVDPIAATIVILPLPILLLMSGLSPHELVEFMCGCVSLSHVGRDRYDRYRRMARRAGHYSLLLGGTGTLIGVIVLLKHLGEPAGIASSIATSLISFFYGLLLKTVVFDPYAQSIEEFGDT